MVFYVAPSPPLEVDLYKPNTVARFSKHSSIESAFTRMTSEVEGILELKKFSKLRRACIQRINSLGSNLPKSLVPKIQQTHSLDDMLDVLAQSPYWNWFDTRLLQALVSASGSSEAEEWLESFKTTFYAEKVTKFIPYVSIKPFKDSVDLVEKFDKDPKDLTISDLLQHKYKLEYEVLDIDEGDLVLCCIKTGCVELTWQVPEELVYRAYTSIKRKQDELSSFAIKSLVCKKADDFVDLPFLWQGQEIEEVGPIEPLPEHVRQEPYSLQQGFQWVTLSSGDVEEVVKFACKHAGSAYDTAGFHYIITHPHTRSEWQFAMRKTNGKLVGVVLAFPLCMYLGGVSLMFVYPLIIYPKKYGDKRLWNILLKELQRRTALNKINQFMCSVSSNYFNHIIANTRWYIDFIHLTYQLPDSPTTPGWRKMTTEDVPSALALVNKFSSQFEIRQVFTSEEEFSHYFLSPTLPNRVFTYVVENQNSITELVSYYLTMYDDGCLWACMQILISNHCSVKQLLKDMMVCAIDNGAVGVQLLQFKIKSYILSSLEFQEGTTAKLHLYNYKYPEVSPTNCFYLIL